MVAIFATQFLGHPIVADLIKKRGKCIKNHALAPKLTFLLHFSDLRALILRRNNVRGPTFPEIQKHFNLRERSQSCGGGGGALVCRWHVDQNAK